MRKSEEAEKKSSNYSRKRKKTRRESASVRDPLDHVKRYLGINIPLPTPDPFIQPGHDGPVEDPHPNDVLCGRGGKINNHRGNIRFREIIATLKPHYLHWRNKKMEKSHMAALIAQRIRSLDPPGRFLKKDESSGMWLDIGDEKARKKVGQALRENASDMREEEESKQQQKPAQVQMQKNVERVYEAHKRKATGENKRPSTRTFSSTNVSSSTNQLSYHNSLENSLQASHLHLYHHNQRQQGEIKTMQSNPLDQLVFGQGSVTPTITEDNKKPTTLSLYPTDISPLVNQDSYPDSVQVHHPNSHCHQHVQKHIQSEMLRSDQQVSQTLSQSIITPPNLNEFTRWENYDHYRPLQYHHTTANVPINHGISLRFAANATLPSFHAQPRTLDGGAVGNIASNDSSERNGHVETSPSGYTHSNLRQANEQNLSHVMIPSIPKLQHVPSISKKPPNNMQLQDSRLRSNLTPGDDVSLSASIGFPLTEEEILSIGDESVPRDWFDE